MPVLRSISNRIIPWCRARPTFSGRFTKQQNNIMFSLPIISFSSVSWFEIIIIASLLVYIIHTHKYIFTWLYINVYYIYIYIIVDCPTLSLSVVKLLLIKCICVYSTYTVSCTDKNKILLYFVRKRRWLFKKTYCVRNVQCRDVHCEFLCLNVWETYV